jgi:hypothetical protein
LAFCLAHCTPGRGLGFRFTSVVVADGIIPKM